MNETPRQGPVPVSGSTSPQAQTPAPVVADNKDHRAADPIARHIWDRVARSPIHSLWDLQGVSLKSIAKRTGSALLGDDLLSRAAELGYYFLFALFPTLISATSILGLTARHASQFYEKLLNYFALVVPPSAYQMVIDTFNQTSRASTGGKITLGLAAALWSASVGFSAIQDGMNTVYRVKETRPYWKARGSAILVTILLSIIVTVNLSVLLFGDFLAKLARGRFGVNWMGSGLALAIHLVSWTVAVAMLMLLFSTIYYYAPNLPNKRWHWLTPGATIGILTWVLASIGLRVYLHYFNSYSMTYGSLGAVIILLTWFYLTGLTLLLGAEVNSEIHASVIECQMKERGQLPPDATAHPELKEDPAHPQAPAA